MRKSGGIRRKHRHGVALFDSLFEAGVRLLDFQTHQMVHRKPEGPSGRVSLLEPSHQRLGRL
jgi:hypothetical protein